MTLTEYVEKRLKTTEALYASCFHDVTKGRLWAKIEAFKEVLEFIDKHGSIEEIDFTKEG